MTPVYQSIFFGIKKNDRSLKWRFTWHLWFQAAGPAFVMLIPFLTLG